MSSSRLPYKIRSGGGSSRERSSSTPCTTLFRNILNKNVKPILCLICAAIVYLVNSRQVLDLSTDFNRTNHNHNNNNNNNNNEKNENRNIRNNNNNNNKNIELLSSERNPMMKTSPNQIGTTRNTASSCANMNQKCAIKSKPSYNIALCHFLSLEKNFGDELGK
jgi:mannitol-specific phosphotransferase system IIBC component